jgi:hypothetical protein
MSGILHRIFNATPPAEQAGAKLAPVQAAAEQGTKVQAYLDRCSAESQAITGVQKYYVKLERDDFNNRNRPAPPTSVGRYLAAGREVARPAPRKGPTGVQQYLTVLATGEAA